MSYANAILGKVIALALVYLCQGHVDMETYRQMPPLYAAHEYRECLQQTNAKQPFAASYCLVYVEIQPDNNTLVWHLIVDFHNTHPYHYRHDQLYRGVCTAKCEKYRKSLDDKWNVTVIHPTSDNAQMAKVLHVMSRQQKSILQYESNMHECVNYEMQQKYNLSVRTFVKYCDNPYEPLEKGPWYIYTILIFVGIVTLNILSSFYDFYLKFRESYKTINVNYYDTNHKNVANKYLTSFSLHRNYRRLVVPNNSAIGKDLQFVDGFRTILSYTIVFEHTALLQYMPLRNSEFFENAYSTTVVRSMMHMPVCIELFFALSGLMLYMKLSRSEYLSTASSLKECITVYVRMMISRHLRFLPSLLFLILFSSNILIHLQRAPFWRHVMEPHVALCRSDWWSNISMTTNLKLNKTCWLHTWYIAADFQLYAFFLAVLVIAIKYPHCKKFVYTTIGIIGVSLPSIIIFIKNFTPLPIMNMENFRHMYVKDVGSGEYIYLSPYSNLNGFLFGILCGELYTKYLKYDNYKHIVGRYLKPLPLFGWLTIFSIWYMGTHLLFRKPTIWTALFPILYKPLSVAIAVTIVIVLKLCDGGGFLTWSIFRLLARISYQVYLWHFIILFMVFAKAEKLIYASYSTMGILNVIVYILTAIASFFIAIMVEYPVAELLTAFELKNKPKREKNT